MSIEFLKEAIQEVAQRNSDYCVSKIDKIRKLIDPIIQSVGNAPKQDESIFVFIYYRKGSDMESHSSRAEIVKYCNDIDTTLAESRFEKLKNGYEE